MAQVDDERARTEAFARLQELIAIGHQYDVFARANPSQATAQIAELNAQGLQEDAWDLLWVPGVLRAKIARVSSIIVLELCRMPGHPEHDPALMDALMPTAILAACVVAHSYGLAAEIPPRPLRGHLDILAGLLHRVTVEQPEELETITRTSVTALPTVQPPIVGCLPSRVRGRLLGLAHILAGRADPVGLKIVTVILIIGAVAAETFEPLDFSGVASQVTDRHR